MRSSRRGGRGFSVIVLLSVLAAPAAADQGARYLVICPDTMLAAIRPLADWKHATGMMTAVAPLSEVGNDTHSIRSYIRNAWDNWPVRPENVLLIGDGATLAAGIYNQGEYYGSDNLYGDMTGDLRAEIPVGRLPARNAAELQVMVAKSLAYERPDPADSLWMRRLTTIVREDGDPNDSIYWNNARYAAELAGAAGFVGCDSLSYHRGDSARHIVASVTAGTGIVLYRGQACGNWWVPLDARPESTRNGTMLPVICSFTCGTMSLLPGEREVGDDWLSTGAVGNLRGAVAFFGNTHCQGGVARYRGAITRGFFGGLFTEGIYRLGPAMLRAKARLLNEFPADTSDYRAFTIYGDPALPIWTAAPRLPSVDHPGGILPDSQTIRVTVRQRGSPVESALVCISFDTLVYSCGYTDDRGLTDLSVEPPPDCSLRLVVTGQHL
ncbi:hypothetical protein FJY71_04690, partial [candidate division WOR-3 bacterium]|nr:hypothetical protein [candidate division WOR-3 bacterium]